MTLTPRALAARLTRPQTLAERSPAGDLGIGALKLNRRKLSARVEEAVLDAQLERTIEGASTLTLTLLDPERELFRTGFLNLASTCELDGLGYESVRFSWDSPGTTATLAFEDREIALLRKRKGARKAVRGKSTRAQFVESLVREVTEQRIGLYSPELTKRQPIKAGERESTPERMDRAEADRRKEPGFASGVSLRMGWSTANSEQVANAERVMATARSLGAPKLAVLALIEACLVEAPNFANPTGGDRTSVGILQLLDIHLGGSTSTSGGRRDIELVARMFLTQGFTGRGGAIELARKNPSWTPGQIAQAAQGSAYPDRYEERRGEADAILAAFGGGSDGGAGALAGPESTTRERPYEFRREAGESSWAAITRLAEEVRWRAFVVAGVLYFISEDDLFRSRPLATLSEDSPGVDGIDFEVNLGTPVQEATLTGRAGRWSVPPGAVVVLERMGPANGRWLVSRISRSLFDPAVTVELRKPLAELAEPAAETVTTTTGGGGAGGGYQFPTELPSGLAPGAPVSLNYQGAKSEPGGEGGNWAGSQPIAEALAALISPPTRVTSTKRGTRNTADGNVSDHFTGSTAAYAIDCFCTSAEGDAGIRRLGEAVGRPGFTGGSYQRFVVGSHGVQLLWRVAGHLDHIHIGVKRI